jgi:hypothetical protein
MPSGCRMDHFMSEEKHHQIKKLFKQKLLGSYPLLVEKHKTLNQVCDLLPGKQVH